MEFLRAGYLSNSTQNLYLQVIKSLYRYAVDTQYVYESPVKGIRLESYKPKSIKQAIITNEDVRSFSSFLEDGNLSMRRNRALLCAVFFCTLKISEALSLRRSDFLLHEDGSYLKVTSKKAKNRLVSVPEYARNVILDYIKDVQGIEPDEYLFCTFVGKI